MHGFDVVQEDDETGLAFSVLMKRILRTCSMHKVHVYRAKEDQNSDDTLCKYCIKRQRERVGRGCRLITSLSDTQIVLVINSRRRLKIYI